MDYTTIYEFTQHSESHSGAVTAFIFFFVGLAVLISGLRNKALSVYDKFRRILFGSALTMIMLLFMAASFFGASETEDMLREKYVKHDYEVVAGEVSNYSEIKHKGGVAQSFSVNGVRFGENNVYGSTYSFFRDHKSKSIITGNGQQVRISYLLPDRSILKIEATQTDK